MKRISDHAGTASRIALVCSVVLTAPAAAGVLYVNSAAPAGGDGTTWRRAYRNVQAALSAAHSGDSIWVAAGTYYPPAAAGREASFELKSGVSLYGGFRGNETALSARDWLGNLTVLSGDIGERNVPGDNAYHVVRGADGAVLDGFIITGGNGVPEGPPQSPPQGAASGRRGPGGRPSGAPIHISPQQILSGPGRGQGGGMLNYQAAPTVRNCVFENNRAAKGGAVYNMTSSSFPPRPDENRKVPLFINCTFRNNFAAGRAGGVSNDLGTAPVFLNCVFENNETPQKGGGMYNDFGCSPVLINCLFRGNKAETAAAMGNDGGSSPIVKQCTFTANRAASAGPSLYQGTGPANNPVVLESVIWGNHCEWESPGIYNWHDNTPVVEDSIVEGGYPGASAEDPRLDSRGAAANGRGYQPGDARFTEETLPALLRSLARFRTAAFEPGPKPGAPRPPGYGRAIPTSNRIVYVNAAASGAGGRSWTQAYASLERAIADAAKDGAEVWVAAGVYKPSGAARAASFTLQPGVRLYGGFTGRETARDQRDWKRNRTTLSGDLGVEGDPADNAYHVVTGANGAVLDGFTITGGYADAIGYDGKGGGLINYRRAPQRRPNHPDATGYSTEVRNCTFTGNYARDGGAVYNYDRGTPKFLNCVFSANRSGNGGAVLDRVGVEAVYEDCEFTGNAARWRGGAAYFDYGSRPQLLRGAFRANSTGGHGGAIYSASRASQLENTVVSVSDCRFENNRATGDGGAASFDDSTVASVKHCAFRANQAGRNGGALAVTNRSSLESEGNRFEGNAARGQGADVFREERVQPARPPGP